MKPLLILSIVCSLFLAACNNGNNKEKEQENIAAAEKELFGNQNAASFDSKKAESLAQSYEQYASNYSDDPKAPEYLFKAGEVLRSAHQFDAAIDNYKKIYEKYPNFNKTPQSLFLIGFTYENDLKNITEAQKYYELFLQKYPNHEMADDAKFLLQNLGKSPEDIIKDFMHNDSTKQVLATPAS
ncbi:MAG: tetratricopeptide repeat protein [Chitinophagales bacterium]|nr:tetratricopeptide repeat protein [Bacteroidota bacterium]MCB9044204.1 tetratricopeptide repeat protein [Chitinophagales bacterium]